MAMSAGGNDGLFRMAETAAPDDDRIMPKERIYLKTGKTVDLSDAISLLKKRKKDPSARIVGGLDDNSDKVRKIAKKESITTAPSVQIEEIKEASEAAQTNNNDAKASQNVTFEKDNAKPRLSGRCTTVDMMKELMALKTRMNEMLTLQKNSLSKETSAEEKKESTDFLSALLAARHRVTFQIEGMEFTISCLSMINDPSTHCLVLCFDERTDSFFTPPVRSELTIKYDGETIAGRLFYFGMSFRLRELGLRFLGFLTDAQTPV